ncbi:MAG: NAD(P)H-hydrate epimerase [Actinobacteria bacterium]|nr:NAD(P)H-hydrate epimerase [Actinomycetota bacterium]
MRLAFGVDQIRAAESQLLARDGDETVMRRAATGLAVTCGRLLVSLRGRVTGSRVVLLVGSGNNGGDALWAGARLAERGAQVTAIQLGSVLHEGGARALRVAGGRVVAVSDGESLIESADLVIDGIVGIGGRGALRSDAAALARTCLRSGAVVVAVDLPSGVDADTGAVAEPDAVIRADVTVTFGALKPGLLVMPAAELAGVVELVDIGLGPFLTAHLAVATTLQANDIALALPTPTHDDHKYSRGVVVVDAGSTPYPGAGVLATGAARVGGAGLVQYGGASSDLVAARYPDVVVADIAGQRATAHIVGPGLAGEAPSPEVLGVSEPVLLDATALRWLADSVVWQQALAARVERGAVTVLTPHEGEFRALGGSGEQVDRVGAAKAAAARWGAVVLLKGATTVVAEPGGQVWINPMAPPALATAGSGDVLSGLAGSWLAAAHARALADGHGLTAIAAGEAVAGAAWVHALAARVAQGDPVAPIAALDVLEALPRALAVVRGVDQ